MTPRERWDRIAGRMRTEPGVKDGTGFGSSPGLRVDGRMLAFLVGERLVLKLPAERCRVLLEQPHVRTYERGQGRPLREWIAVEPDHEGWEELCDEACRFVGAGGRA